MQALSKLKDWFEEIIQDFDTSTVPEEKQVDYSIKQVLSHLGVRLSEYLGKGDNGIAFLANDGDVVKFTIDANEAYLWQRLKDKPANGIISVNQILNLASSKDGNSIIFIIKVDYAPYDLDNEEVKLIRATVEKARKQNQIDRQKMMATGRPDQTKMWEQRTINFVQAFEDLADQHQQFSQIPEMLLDIADKNKAYLYDLQPSNFRKNSNGVVLIDPSVPDLIGDLPQVQQIMYEEKIRLLGDILTIFL